MSLLPPQIKAITFDAYGTLFDVYSIGARLQHHFGEKSESISQVWRRKQLEYTWLRTLMERYKPFSEVTREALVFACTQAGEEISKFAEKDLMQQYLQLPAYPEVPDLLERLSGPYSLGILSNANPDMLEAAVQRNGLARFFHHILSADEVQQFKPAPPVYRLAEKHWGLPPDQIAFVSSNTWDVSGAKAAGLFVVWLNRGTQPMEQLDFTPDKEIKALHRLLPT